MLHDDALQTKPLGLNVIKLCSKHCFFFKGFEFPYEENLLRNYKKKKNRSSLKEFHNYYEADRMRFEILVYMFPNVSLKYVPHLMLLYVIV